MSFAGRAPRRQVRRGQDVKSIRLWMVREWTCCSFGRRGNGGRKPPRKAARGPKGRRAVRRGRRWRHPGSDPSRSRATWPSQVRRSGRLRQIFRPPTPVLASSAGGAPEQAAAEAKEPRDLSGRGAFFVVHEKEPDGQGRGGRGEGAGRDGDR